MKILFVCHRFPYPPNRGGKIRPFYMIKHLAKDHEVVVASLVRSAEEAEAGAPLKDFCARAIMESVGAPMSMLRMLLRLPTPTPSSMGYFYSPELARKIQKELADGGYQLIFIHCSSVAQYVLDAPGIPKILDFGDMDSQKWLAYAQAKKNLLAPGYLLEGLKLRRAEIDMAKKSDFCTCTTPAEVDTLKSYGTGVPCTWIPNGVNHEYFKPTGEEYDPRQICFLGRMDYYPNAACMIDFCAGVFPLLKAKIPGIRLKIVGADPSRKVVALGRIDGVEVTGSVPDVRPFLQRSALSIAPLGIARGTQNKILESLAMGVPVVCSQAAAGGIDAVPGEHFLVASTPEEYAAAILRLLDNPKERRTFAEAGRARILSHHSWDRAMEKLDEIIEKYAGARLKSVPDRT